MTHEIMLTVTNQEDALEREQDSLKVFLTEICRHPILSRRQEVELAQAIENGNEDESRQAKELLVKSNYRLVISIARRNLNSGMEMTDLIQEGMFGLMKAVNKFEWRLGYKFSTFATWWIRQAISQAINDKASAIRVPHDVYCLLNRRIRANRELENAIGREPTDEEIGQWMNVPVATVQKLKGIDISRKTVPIDIPVGYGETATLSDIIEDQSSISPSEEFTDSETRWQIESILKNLTPREEKIIRMRFGLGCDEHTLIDIAEEVGVTRERIRQIEAEALRKLRLPSVARHLKALHQ